jgi:hypothetical protein
MGEEELRRKGFAKTPDILLNIPILVEGVVVNWIDSKAYFGDEYWHKQNHAQLWGYRDRYGPGMVIYWCGFLEHLQTKDKGILLVDTFPEKIETLVPPLSDIQSAVS